MPENEISKLFEAKKGDVTVEDILQNRDLLVALRFEPPDLLNFIISDIPGSPCHVKEILDYALHPAPEKFLDRQQLLLSRLSIAATRLLSAPSSALSQRLCRPSKPSASSELFLNTLRGFPDTENGRSNPVFCGHFQEILLTVWRANTDLLTSTFRGFLSVALNHVELIGYQDILVNLCGERTDYIALPQEDPVHGFRLISARALKFADDFLRDQTVLPCRRLQGIINVLWQVFAEREPDDFVKFTHDLEFMRDLVLAVFRAPLARDMRAAFLEGVHLLKKLIAIGGILDKTEAEPGEEGRQRRSARSSEAVRAFIKQFAIGFYERHGVASLDWNAAELTAEQKMLINAFPVLWQGGIDWMVPIFFRVPIVSGDFNRAFFEGIGKLGRVRFLTWIDSNKILDRIMGMSRFSPLIQEDEDGQPLGVSVHPQIWNLARYIASGLFKKASLMGKPRPLVKGRRID